MVGLLWSCLLRLLARLAPRSGKTINAKAEQNQQESLAGMGEPRARDGVRLAAYIFFAVAIGAAIIGAAVQLTSSGGSSVGSDSATLASSPGTQTSPSSSASSTCVLWNYPPVLNSYYDLTNSTLLQGNDVVGLSLEPHEAFYYGFVPSQDVKVTGEIQTQTSVPITVEIFGGNGSDAAQPSYQQTGTDVRISVSLPVGNEYRLVLEDTQNQQVALTITQSLVVHYPGC